MALKIEIDRNNCLGLFRTPELVRGSKLLGFKAKFCSINRELVVKPIVLERNGSFPFYIFNNNISIREINDPRRMNYHFDPNDYSALLSSHGFSVIEYSIAEYILTYCDSITISVAEVDLLDIHLPENQANTTAGTRRYTTMKVEYNMKAAFDVSRGNIPTFGLAGHCPPGWPDWLLFSIIKQMKSQGLSRSLMNRLVADWNTIESNDICS